jgi:hypothetical protein
MDTWMEVNSFQWDQNSDWIDLKRLESMKNWYNHKQGIKRIVKKNRLFCGDRWWRSLWRLALCLLTTVSDVAPPWRVWWYGQPRLIVFFFIYTTPRVPQSKACIPVHLPLILLPGFELYFWRLIVSVYTSDTHTGNMHELALGQDVQGLSTSTHL